MSDKKLKSFELTASGSTHTQVNLVFNAKNKEEAEKLVDEILSNGHFNGKKLEYSFDYTNFEDIDVVEVENE